MWRQTRNLKIKKSVRSVPFWGPIDFSRQDFFYNHGYQSDDRFDLQDRSWGAWKSTLKGEFRTWQTWVKCPHLPRGSKQKITNLVLNIALIIRAEGFIQDTSTSYLLASVQFSVILAFPFIFMLNSVYVRSDLIVWLSHLVSEAWIQLKVHSPLLTTFSPMLT